MTGRDITAAFASPAERRERGPRPIEWVWDGYIARRAVTLLVGAPKQGKSTLACALTESIASDGSEFLGRQVLTAPVVYVTEEGETTALEKLRHPDVRLLSREDVWPRPSWAEVIAAAGTVAQTVGAALLVIDTFPAWANFAEKEENDTGAVQRALEPLFGIARSGLGVLVIAHPPRNGSHAVRGAGALEGGVDAIAKLTKGKTANARELEAQARWTTPETQHLQWTPGSGWTAASSTAAHDTDLRRVLEALVNEPGLGKRGVRDACKGIARERVDAAIERGLSNGLIRNDGTSGRFSYVSVAATLRHASEGTPEVRAVASASQGAPSTTTTVQTQGTGESVAEADPAPVGGSAPPRIENDRGERGATVAATHPEPAQNDVEPGDLDAPAPELPEPAATAHDLNHDEEPEDLEHALADFDALPAATATGPRSAIYGWDGDA